MITIEGIKNESKDSNPVYSVTTDKDYTVDEFIDEFLKCNLDSKGIIKVNNHSATTFENGRLLGLFPKDILSSRFIHGSISGTDYFKLITIYTKETYVDVDNYKIENKTTKPILGNGISRVAPVDVLPPIQIRYHHELYPELEEVKLIDNGDYVDLRAAEDIELKQFEFAIIPLGVSMKLPDGYYAILTPRSSTFKKYGIIQTNSIGIIDNSYSGDNDIWGMPVLAMRDTKIKANDRICQFTISKSNASNMRFEKVDKLDGKDRGGFGSTGVK